MNESNTTRQASSIRPEKHLMQEQFNEVMTGQSKVMGNFAHQVLLAEFAMLGLYAVALKLFTGAVTVDFSLATITALVCWATAIACTVFAITPPQLDDNDSSDTEVSFEQAIQQKQALLVPSLVLFVTGFLVILWNLYL